MARHIKRKRFMSEINVVPYIDVMLVLLIIFMITAPLLTQGINVNLPTADANPVTDQESDPIVVNIDRDGNIYINSGADPDEPVTAEELITIVSAFIRNNPQLPIYIGSDESVPHGRVVAVMSLLQRAGVPSIGILTKPPES